MSFDRELKDRLVRYAAIDSQSDAASQTSPSTSCQFDMLHLLQKELGAIGAGDVRLTDYGAVLATIPATAQGPTIGLLAHVDTAPQFKATGVKPRVIANYDGGNILYPDDPDLVLSPADSPILAQKTGHDIITASGTTLLGADDKAGVAVIMTVARHLLERPDIPHGRIRIAFTPDEEIGRGVDTRLPGDLGAEFAYTIDGSSVGEIEYETFSADAAEIDIDGVSIHPGWATGKLVNAALLAAKIVAALPQKTMTPETTSGREGFIFVTGMSGGSSAMQIRLILRDFELDGLEEKRALVRRACQAAQQAEPRATIRHRFHPQYRNTRYWLEKDMTPVELAYRAARSIGIDPVSKPFRGGTDGSRLTELGVPTTNLFCGMQNIHGPLEWVSVQDMAQSVRLILALVGLAAEDHGVSPRK